MGRIFLVVPFFKEVPMNLRRFQRKKVPATAVEISDGIRSTTGVVNNVSNPGIEIHLTSESIDQLAPRYSLSLSPNSQAHRVAAIPQWWSNGPEGSRWD